jgi:hypothetical protein
MLTKNQSFQAWHHCCCQRLSLYNDREIPSLQMSKESIGDAELDVGGAIQDHGLALQHRKLSALVVEM